MKRVIDRYEMRAELWGSFLLFCQTFFPLVTGRPFVLSNPPGRESHFITIARELTKCADLETDSLLINCPPGSGKSVMMCMFVAWQMSRWPDSQFLYISYSSILSAKHTAFIKRILECRYYQDLFDIKLRQDSKAKDFFSTNHGGVVKAFGSASSITGNDGGLPNLDRFSGAVICFPYDEVVPTEHGPMKIGEIVERKLRIKVWSMNLETRQIELQPIQGWYENPGSDIVEVGLSDGSLVKCTPDHHIWTENRGWVEAQELTFSDHLTPAPNCSLRNTQNNRSSALVYRQIVQCGKLLFSKCIKLPKSIFSLGLFMKEMLSFFPSHISSTNFVYSMNVNPVLFMDILRQQGAKYDIDNILCTQFTTRMSFAHTKCPMIFSIFDVFTPCSITQIFNSIVGRNAINMPCVTSFRFGTQKSQSDQLMDKMHFTCAIFAQCGSKIRSVLSIVLRQLFNVSMNNPSRSAITRNEYPLFTSHSAQARHTIKPLKSRNVSPLFIRHVGHADKTYCINVQHNHNFFCGSIEDMYVLVRNCDDLTRPDDSHSTNIRESIQRNYKETILQRLRGPNVPIICIAQRLHEDDICAYMLSGKDERKYKSVILKAIDDAGNALYPEVNPLSQLLEKKEKSPYVFASQYQQNPIPAGGALFQRENFPILWEDPNILCTFITADTAETDKSWNDASAFSFWGVYLLEDGVTLALHWLDALEVRVEPKDLKDAFLSFHADCMRYKVPPQFAAIEKKSTGVTLVSILKDTRGLQIREVQRTKASGSKTARFLEMQPYIASKLISFTNNMFHVEHCIKHMMAITANESHRHDDLADTLSDAIRIALIDKAVYLPTADASKKVVNFMADNFRNKMIAVNKAHKKR